MGAAAAVFAVGELASDSEGEDVVDALGAVAGTGSILIVGKVLGGEGTLVGFLLDPVAGTALYNYVKDKLAPGDPVSVPAVMVSVSFYNRARPVSSGIR